MKFTCKRMSQYSYALMSFIGESFPMQACAMQHASTVQACEGYIMIKIIMEIT